MLGEFATDFQPPQKAITGGTGLYAGEQDMFCFLIDPLGWTEIESEAFAPGFFVWNSEVGKRSLGIQTFWFQAVCQNHIVWDAIDVCKFTTKHTSQVQDGLATIRSMIEAIVRKRDERKDAFAAAIRKAMDATLGADAEEVFKKRLQERHSPGHREGSHRDCAGERAPHGLVSGRCATRLAQKNQNAGDRAEADQKAAALLSLVA